jgi:Oxidoreductase family, NAD-binding Rossmann fold
MLQVGLIGLGAQWQRHYCSAFQRLRQRIAIRCCYAPLPVQSAQLAAELNCDVAAGLVSLLERNDVQAVVVLRTDWHGEAPLRLASDLGKPVFVAEPMAWDLLSSDWHTRAADAGQTIMPGLTARYLPATSRLRELIATRLGRPLEYHLDLQLPSLTTPASERYRATESTLAAALDWCTSLAGASPSHFQLLDSNPAAAAAPLARQQMLVDFRPSPASEQVPQATFTLLAHEAPPSADTEPAGALARLVVRCERGTAALTPPHELSWKSSGEQVCESLTSDRTAAEVLLDHFTRRSLGGLIPVPSMDDVFRAKQFAAKMARAVNQTSAE